MSVLMCAAKHGHLEMATLLVTEFKAEIDAEDDVIPYFSHCFCL